MFKELNEMRKKTSSLLYVLNTTADCRNYSGNDDNIDNYDDVNTYLLKYGETQYCVTDVTDKWDIN